jgi:hypothetical protein
MYLASKLSPIRDMSMRQEQEIEEVIKGLLNVKWYSKHKIIQIKGRRIENENWMQYG